MYKWNEIIFRVLPLPVLNVEENVRYDGSTCILTVIFLFKNNYFITYRLCFLPLVIYSDQVVTVHVCKITPMTVSTLKNRSLTPRFQVTGGYLRVSFQLPRRLSRPESIGSLKLYLFLEIVYTQQSVRKVVNCIT